MKIGKLKVKLPKWGAVKVGTIAGIVWAILSMLIVRIARTDPLKGVGIIMYLPASIVRILWQTILPPFTVGWVLAVLPITLLTGALLGALLGLIYKKVVK